MPMHVKDGGVWKEVQKLHVKDGGAWKEVTTGSVRDGGSWKEFFASSAVALTNNSIYAFTVGGSATAGIRFKTNGELEEVNNGSPTAVSGEWFTPVGSPSGYRVRATSTGDPLSSGPTLGVWHALSTQREWSLNRSIAGFGQSVLTIDIDDGSGTPIVTATITLQAEWV